MTPFDASAVACDDCDPLRIGVVIPARDEENFIAQTIRCVRERGHPAVFVVANSASTDQTAPRAAAAGAIVTGGPEVSNRAAALNAGARRALAEAPNLDVLWFLHADCQPPRDWDLTIRTLLQDHRNVGGAFGFGWNMNGVPLGARPGLHAIAIINRIRMRLTRNYYGDQGLFVRVATFSEVGGFPDVPLMEDLLMSRRMKKTGRVALAPGRIIASPRRFLRHGVIRQAIVDAFLLAAERFGIKPQRLHAWYNREKA